MKLHKLFAALLITVFAFSMLNCGGEKTEKEKAVEFATQTIEFFSTEEGQQLAEARSMDFQKKLNDIAQDAGFENLEQALETMGKLREDEEIKGLNEKLNKLFQ